DVIIDFEAAISTSLLRSKQLILPVKYGAKTYKIKIDRKSLKDHKLVQQIIENELRLQIAQERTRLDEQFRLQEQKRLKEQSDREKRESDYNPATATRDGQGVFLPIGF
ncbi:hypothetical protein MJH12_17105, partial [bacterium]|nr:hypothetical protein [bacterium]